MTCAIYVVGSPLIFATDMMKIKNNNLCAALAVMLLTFLISGCVTKEYVYGANNTVNERTKNGEDAAMARLKLAIEYLRQDKIAAAKQNLDRAAAISPNIDGVASSYAFYYQKVGENELADKSYRQAVRQFPQNSDIRNNYGAFLCELKRYQQANRQFVLAINTESNNQIAQTHENAGLCALRDNNWSTAQLHLTKVLNYYPNHARALLGLAKANLELSNLIGARTQLATYNKKYIQTPESLWVQIQIEHKAQNFAMVKGLGQILLRNYPSSNAAIEYGSKDL